MAGISTADDQNESLDTLRSRYRYAHARLKSDPNGAPYVADFAAFGAEWALASQKEADKEDAIIDAEAAAVSADAALDRLVRRVSSAIFGGKKVNASLPLATVYFGGSAPSDFMRPVLGKQLSGMSTWPALLSQATQPSLRALAPEASVVPVADAAAKALSTAIADRDLFRDGGERKRLFDHFNALCAKAYGGLKALEHSHPELELPPGYAESFFMQGPSPSAQPTTVAAADALIKRLEQKLGKATMVKAALVQKDSARKAEALAHEQALSNKARAKQLKDEAEKALRDADEAAKKTKPKKK
jgi:hypothetical protein